MILVELVEVVFAAALRGQVVGGHVDLALPLKVNSPSSDLRVACSVSRVDLVGDHGVVAEGDLVARVAHAVADAVGVLTALGQRGVGREVAELDAIRYCRGSRRGYCRWARRPRRCWPASRPPTGNACRWLRGDGVGQRLPALRGIRATAGGFAVVVLHLLDGDDVRRLDVAGDGAAVVADLADAVEAVSPTVLPSPGSRFSTLKVATRSAAVVVLQPRR